MGLLGGMGRRGVHAVLPLSLILATTQMAGAGQPRFAAAQGIREIIDSGTGDAMPLRIWYPVQSDDRPEPIDANPSLIAARTFGLIAISHGARGTTLDHADTAVALAQDGWIVVAPRHPRDNSDDNSGEGSASVWRGRPHQLHEAIDAVLADPTFGPMVDVRRIGAIGFSSGGYTVLALIGAIPDLQAARVHCSAHRDEDAACRGGTFWSTIRTVWGVLEDLLVGRREAWQQLRDPRIGAAVLLAPLAVFFDSSAFGNVHVPVRIYRAEQDEVLSSPFHAERVRDLLPILPEYSVVPGAPHQAFLDPSVARNRMPLWFSEGGKEFDTVALHRTLNAEIVEFFDRALRGEAGGVAPATEDGRSERR